MGVRTLLLLAKLLFLDLANPDDGGPEGQAFVFLGHADKAAVDENLLLDAVAIYTRDLGVSLLQSPGKQPAAVTPQALDDVTALLRARGARLAFWCQAVPGARQIELVAIDPRRTIARYSFDPDTASKSDLYRSIALRLRAILVGAEPGDAPGAPAGRVATTPAAPASPVVVPPPITEPAVERPRPPPSEPQPPTPPAEDTFRSLPARAGTPPGGESHMFFGVGYAPSYPLGTSGGAAVRHALALDVVVATHPHLEWDLGTDLSPAADHASSVAALSVMDVPLRAGGRWLHEVAPFVVGGGPFLGVHWLSANASAGTMTDRRTAFGASVGADAVARGPVLAGFAPQVRLWVEVNAPRTRFTIQNVPNYDVGAVRVGLGVEITAPAR